VKTGSRGWIGCIGAAKPVGASKHAEVQQTDHSLQRGEAKPTEIHQNDPFLLVFLFRAKKVRKNVLQLLTWL
jgi:hypothetical protein